MVGSIKDIEIDSDSDEEESDEKFETAAERKRKNDSKKSVFSMFKYMIDFQYFCEYIIINIGSLFLEV